MSTNKHSKLQVRAFSTPINSGGDMPWVAKDAKRHNKKVRSQGEATEWAETADATLKSTGNEGEAIATANKRINEHQRHGAKRGRKVKK